MLFYQTRQQDGSSIISFTKLSVSIETIKNWETRSDAVLPDKATGWFIMLWWVYTIISLHDYIISLQQRRDHWSKFAN